MSKLQESFDENTFVINLSDALDHHNKLVSALENSRITCTQAADTSTYTLTSNTYYDAIDCSYHRDIVYIHKTNCPNCGGLLDGDEHSPYVKCACCGAKIWSEREVS